MQVMCANFSYAPYIRAQYDRLDAFGCIVQGVVFVLGLSVYYRKSIATTTDALQSAGTAESYVLLLFQ